MAEATRSTSTIGIVVWIGVFLILIFFVGLGIVTALAIIPTYIATNSVTPLGEKYCVNNLRVTIAFNSSIYFGFSSARLNTSYPLSIACTRILQNYYSDSQLSSCLISNCSVSNRTIAQANIIRSENVTCTSTTVYYSVRCPDQGILSGLYNYVTSFGNSNCRKKRMARINGALGSTNTTRYTNVSTLATSNTVIAVISVYSQLFPNNTQSGTQYCGAISQTDIARAVNNQTSG